MRCIAVMNQKGGVGKTTTTANLGAALALQGRRVVVVDMDAQANLSLSLNVEAAANSPSSYTVLTGSTTFEQALRPTAIPRLRLVASHLDLSGAELELASTIGREYVMRDALRQWIDSSGGKPADYVLFDCPPSLGLLSINALAASQEVLITLQTEFLALQGMSKLIDVVQLLRRRLNPDLSITGILPCLYDSRLKLAREVLGEIRTYFPGQVLPKPVRSSVKLAEAPSYGRTIFEYAPESNGAHDYMNVAREIIRQESRDPALAGLPQFDESIQGMPSPDVAPSEVPAPRTGVAERGETTIHAKDATRAESAARARAAKQLRAAQRTQAETRVAVPPPTDAPARVEVSPAADASARVEVSRKVDAAPAVGDSPRSPSKRARLPIREIPAAPKPTASAAPVSVPSAAASPVASPSVVAPSVRSKSVVTPSVRAPSVVTPSVTSSSPLAPAKKTPPATARVVAKPAAAKSRVTTPSSAAPLPVAPQPTPKPTLTPASPPATARKSAAKKASASNTPALVPAPATAQPAHGSRELPAARPAPSTIRPPLTRPVDVDVTDLRRDARAEDFPPLPPDAFEILTSFGRGP